MLRRLLSSGAVLATALTGGAALAHGVSDQAKQRMIDGGPLDFAVAGAEHMLTGYDHLLLLLGALFLLPRFLDILKFATAFTLGHTITLLGATRLGIRADAHLVDAFIALTVIAIGLLNLRDGERLRAYIVPLTFAFGLIHGFGLSTGIQDMTLRGDPTLMPKLLSFNVGVELGQLIALVFIAAVLTLWRQSPAWSVLKRAMNIGIAIAGCLLFAEQIHSFATGSASQPPTENRTT